MSTATAVAACPSWCSRQHGPGEAYHTSESVIVPGVDDTFDVHLSYDPVSDSECLVEVAGQFLSLLTVPSARQLANALLKATEAATR